MSFMFILHYMASGVLLVSLFLRLCLQFTSCDNPLASFPHALVEIPPCFVSLVSLMSSVASYHVYCLTWAASL